jgi:hypothetical protein
MLFFCVFRASSSVIPALFFALFHRFPFLDATPLIPYGHTLFFSNDWLYL